MLAYSIYVPFKPDKIDYVRGLVDLKRKCENNQPAISLSIYFSDTPVPAQKTGVVSILAHGNERRAYFHAQNRTGCQEVSKVRAFDDLFHLFPNCEVGDDFSCNSKNVLVNSDNAIIFDLIKRKLGLLVEWNSNGQLSISNQLRIGENTRL